MTETGLPLVLVHGYLGGSRQWAGLTALAGAPGRVVTVDLPGFGLNAGRDAPDRIGGFADWVLAELTARGIGRFRLLGHSMGGMVVQEMVARAPERVARLVLYGTAASGELPGRFETFDVSKRRTREDGAEATARRIAATWFLRREADPAYPPCAEIAAAASLPAMLSGLDAMAAWEGTGLGAIRCPTLVLWGDGDRSYGWPEIERLWQGIAGAQLAVVPGTSHAVHLEKPLLFEALAGDFLS